MSSGSAFFYAFALFALIGALSSALRYDLRRAGMSLRTAGAGVTGLLAMAGALLAASLMAAVVLTGHMMLRRAHRVDAGLAGGEAVPGGRVRASLLVLAFFVIVSRVVLIARWPVVAATAGEPAMTTAGLPAVMWLPPVGLPHYLLASILLFCVGLFAAITRRSGAGIGMGIALMQAAVTVAIAASAHFTGGGSDARLLAVSLIVLSCGGATVAMRVGNRYGDFANDSDAAHSIATSISAVLAGVTLALLAGAW